jgi:PHP family Zn ribbon phosphoesterase
MDESEELLKQKFEFACRPEGGSFRGTFQDYMKAHQRELMEEFEDDGALLKLEDNDELTEEEIAALIEAVEEAIKAQYGESVEVLDMDGSHALIFHPSTSEIKELDYLITKDGRIELIGDKPIELSELPKQ